MQEAVLHIDMRWEAYEKPPKKSRSAKSFVAPAKRVINILHFGQGQRKATQGAERCKGQCDIWMISPGLLSRNVYASKVLFQMCQEKRNSFSKTQGQVLVCVKAKACRRICSKRQPPSKSMCLLLQHVWQLYGKAWCWLVRINIVVLFMQRETSNCVGKSCMLRTLTPEHYRICI